MRGRVKVVAIGAGLVCAFAASGQVPPSPTPTPSPSPTPSPTRSVVGIDLPSARAEVDRQRSLDATFMTRVMRRGLEEIELARIVAERSSNDGVRAFARDMADERGKAAQELRILAESEGIELPATPDAAGKTVIERVSRASSPELDRVYVENALRDQDADVADFEAQSSKGQEVELQAWVWNTLPLRKDQKEQIHALAGQLGITARGSR
jgi:predicted outer membrane protein